MVRKNIVSTVKLAQTCARPLTIALVAVWGLGFGAVPVAAQSWMAQAMPANLEGGLALFVSALQGSLAAGSAVGGVIYDAKGPGGALVLAASVAAAGSLILLGRAGASISAPSAGSAESAREPGRAAPAPSPGAVGGAGNTAPRPRRSCRSRPCRPRPGRNCHVQLPGRTCHAQRGGDDRIRAA